MPDLNLSRRGLLGLLPFQFPLPIAFMLFPLRLLLGRPLLPFRLPLGFGRLEFAFPFLWA
ncbi:MAG: hypothetical protein H6969_12365 [Gammaproteobacteria bacterium]|nr:hypothetical protein [Gammaproteobacteria bacterium]